MSPVGSAGLGVGAGGVAPVDVLSTHFEPTVGLGHDEGEGDGRSGAAGDIDRLGNGGATYLTGKGQRGLIHNQRLSTQALCGNQREQRQNQGENRSKSLQGRTSKRAGSSDGRTPRRKTFPARRV